MSRVDGADTTAPPSHVQLHHVLVTGQILDGAKIATPQLEQHTYSLPLLRATNCSRAPFLHNTQAAIASWFSASSTLSKINPNTKKAFLKRSHWLRAPWRLRTRQSWPWTDDSSGVQRADDSSRVRVVPISPSTADDSSGVPRWRQLGGTGVPISPSRCWSHSTSPNGTPKQEPPAPPWRHWGTYWRQPMTSLLLELYWWPSWIWGCSLDKLEHYILLPFCMKSFNYNNCVWTKSSQKKLGMNWVL